MVVVDVGNGLESITEPGIGVGGTLCDVKGVSVRPEPLVLHTAA
jgi:hypothetical protein